MITIRNNNFSIKQICESGQCFRFHKIEDNKYAVVALGQYLEIEQVQDEIRFFCTKEEYQKLWSHYFDMDTDYQKFMDGIPLTDHYLYRSVQFGKGIRILHQDIWEIIISFIISQQNNIKRIKKSIALLCERYGEKKQSSNGMYYYDFPSVEALAGATDEELRQCNLGYRSRYVKNTAESILNIDVNMQSIQEMKYIEAKNELLKLCGVGSKVADCICLFGLHHLDAFPVDTHINKVLEMQYPKGFPFEKFAGYAGVIQQYIFYYDLNKEI